MKKFCFVVCLLFLGISVASAQTQRGYVKTRGRLQSNGTTIPGTRLSGATVTLKGNNSVTSGANGVFFFCRFKQVVLHHQREKERLPNLWS